MNQTIDYKLSLDNLDRCYFMCFVPLSCSHFVCCQFDLCTCEIVIIRSDLITLLHHLDVSMRVGEIEDQNHVQLAFEIGNLCVLELLV